MQTPYTLSPAARQRGVSLVELMVGLVIALVVSLVMYNVLIVTENQRRTTGAGADAQQSGSFSTYTLERFLRMGGAGISRVAELVGCEMTLSASGTARLPLPSSIPAPFNTLGLTAMRATPVLIVNASAADDDDATSTTPDALVVMAGTHPNINTWLQMSSPGNATAAPVRNSVGLRTNDLLLAVEKDAGGPNAGACTVVQATCEIEDDPALPNYRQCVNFSGRSIAIGGTYTASSGLAPNGRVYGATTDLANLGNEPLLRIFALGPEATEDGASELRGFNILTNTVESLADGVVNLQAVYGISATSEIDAVTAWVSPTGDFQAETLMDGSAASNLNLRRIRAVRVAVVTRSALLEREGEVGAPAEWSVFADDEAIAITGTRTGDATRYRYRQYDFIAPLRNTLLVN